MPDKNRPTPADLSAYIDGEKAGTDDLDEQHSRLLRQYGRIAHWTRRALEPPRAGDPAACADRVIAALARPPATQSPAPQPLSALVMASLGALTVAGIAAGIAVRRHRGGAR